MEWEPGSRLIGDFVWVGLDSEIVVTDRVMNELLAAFRGFERGAVEMVDNTHPRSTRNVQPRVSLPYEGPALSEMWVTAEVDIDKEHTTATLESTCAHCGRESWNLSGAELWLRRYDVERGLLLERAPRIEHEGIVIKDRDLRHVDVFRVRQLPAWVLCTSPVREFILDRGFTNVGFFEVGETAQTMA
jgi:hypothetical protein